MFDRCTFNLLKVVGGDWSFVGLPGADLRTASFTGVRMREVDLVGARCEGSTLRDDDLSGSWFHRANLSRCDLRGSDVSAVDPLTVELGGAIITFDQAVVLATALGLDVRPE
jgi:fluoroquinolone resistance protein